MPSAQFSVFVSDEHPVVVAGVRLLLRRLKDLKLIGDARDASSTLGKMEREVPDILILDLWIGGGDGIALLRQVRDRWPSVRILVYSMNDERAFGLRAFRLGASGYLMKTRGLEELVKALRIIAAGGRYISVELSSGLIETVAQPRSELDGGRSLANLSDREMQIFQCIGSGLTTAIIAQKLHISVRTVGAHRENLKNKLGLTDAGALAQRAALFMAGLGG